MARPTYHDPFPCGVGDYIGGTYPNHYNAYAVDFNRGVGSTDYGDWVTASADGTVVYRDNEYGRIDIEHTVDGWGSTYGHLQCLAFGSAHDILVAVGDTVEAGQRLGRIGRTYPVSRGTLSPHLHYEQYFDPDGPARVKNSVKVYLEGVAYSASVPVYPSGPRIYGPARTGWCSGVTIPGNRTVKIVRTKNGPAPRTIDFSVELDGWNPSTVPWGIIDYSWSEDGGAPFSTDAAPSRLYTVPGVYIVTVVVHQPAGPQATQPVTKSTFATVKILDTPVVPEDDPDPPDPCEDGVVVPVLMGA